MPKQLFNLFTPVRKVFKRDYHGNLYETTIMGNPDLDYGKLWAEFIERNNQPTVDTMGQSQPVNEAYVQREVERQIFNDENKM